jgi:hypothetical protein
MSLYNTALTFFFPFILKPSYSVFSAPSFSEKETVSEKVIALSHVGNVHTTK